MKRCCQTIAILAAFMLYGCSDEPETQSPLSSGPLTPVMSAEAESILDQHLESLTRENSLTVQFDPSPQDPNFDKYAIVALWGCLNHSDLPGTVTTDWSGAISFTGVGSIISVTPVAFEQPTDEIASSTSSTTASWKSSTRSDYDGIGIMLRVDRTANNESSTSLILNMPLRYVELTLAELDHLSILYPIDDMNAVVIKAHRVQTTICGNGTFVGNWYKKHAEDINGFLSGQWISSSGETIGSYLGSYRVEKNGDHVLKGTIAMAGAPDTVLGHFSGTWNENGTFGGEVICCNYGNIGKIRGEFGVLQPFGRLFMAPLSGSWEFECRDMNSPHAEDNIE